ncbi:MAG: tRNA 2-selenouridine(34) synthase MnmH [Deltaproteobacteria bacterium]|nr:tRNA 2-selenouridine(34) synthase MnmH [Deltaproteobacteria bacterium]
MSLSFLKWSEYSEHPEFTHVIDARTPSEFAQDHIPGAINLPVLSDDERVQVGTTYKRDAFRARKIGAALISRNIADMLEGPLKAMDGSFYPLIYCWRGGQRSQSLALILSQIGFRVSVVEGGYKSYRQKVVSSLDSLPEQFELRLLSGLTGTCKTKILLMMKERGFQVLDLEGLANHRGSLLGVSPETIQPSQKGFESHLATELQSFNPAKPIWLESESNQIGAIHIPSELWRKMRSANVVEVTAPIEARVEYLLEAYDYFCQKPDFLKERIGWLKRIRGTEKIKYWFELIDSQQWTAFVADMLETHYDPTYSRSMERSAERVSQKYKLKALKHLDLLDFIESI